MSEYGLMITGKPAPNEAAMLVEVIRTPIGSNGTYKLPTLPPEQNGKYRHEISLIRNILDVSVTDGYGDVFTGSNAAPRVEAIVSEREVTWYTSTTGYTLHLVQSVGAILIWRYKIG